MEYRKLCQICGKTPVAVNYKSNSKTYYRSRCDSCIRKGKKLSPPKPRWLLEGYKKKPHCEKCGFKSKHPEQFNVLFVDGDLNNCRPANLKTVCANCQRILQKEGVKWRQGDLTPDF
jgi:prepilin-type processing-associated H-X9-DG protein